MTSIYNDPNTLFIAETDNCAVIKSLIEGVKQFADEMNILLTEDYMRMIINSKINQSIVDCKLNASGFNHYNINFENMTDKDVLDDTTDKVKYLKHVYIRTSQLQRLLKNVKSRNTIRFLITKDDEKSFKVEFVNHEANQRVRFNIKQMNITEEEFMTLDEVKYENKISIPTSAFKENISCINSIIGAKYVSITYNGKILSFSSEGESANISADLEQVNDLDEDDSIYIKPCTNKFELGTISNTIKFAGISNNVDVCIDYDNPLLLIYDIDNFGTLKIVISFINPDISDQD
jgi:hypothetical protein